LLHNEASGFRGYRTTQCNAITEFNQKSKNETGLVYQSAEKKRMPAILTTCCPTLRHQKTSDPVVMRITAKLIETFQNVASTSPPAKQVLMLLRITNHFAGWVMV
jgi:hypothetical protein